MISLLCVLFFIFGVVGGCLVYSGRNDCLCSECRRGRWMGGEDPEPAAPAPVKEWPDKPKTWALGPGMIIQELKVGTAEGVVGCDLNLTKFGRWTDGDTHRFPEGEDRCFCGFIHFPPPDEKVAAIAENWKKGMAGPC